MRLTWRTSKTVARRSSTWRRWRSTPRISPGRYIVANAKAGEVAGLQHGELIGLTDEAFLPLDGQDFGSGSDRRVIEDLAPHQSEDTVEIAGESKVFKSIRFPLFNREGEVDAVGGISLDISAESEAAGLREQLSLARERAIEELKISHREAIIGLSNALDLHEPSTGKHTGRVGALAAFLATRLGLDEAQVDLLRSAAPMHDVGKIGTPAEILLKQGTLTPEERAEMERHTVVGYEIFADFQSELARLAGTIALAHHERFDGKGYPQGLAGEEIPLEGRIVAVADVFDAVLSDRSYRPALSVEEAVSVMREGRGTQFDPRIIDLLLDQIDDVIAVRDGNSDPPAVPVSPPEVVVSAETSSPEGSRNQRGIDREVGAVSRSYGDALRAADGAGAERIAFEALHEGISIPTLYERVLAPAMWRIGSLWEQGAITVADEHLATALTHRVMAGIFGSSFGNADSRPGRILLAAVEGQQHALGLRMVADVLELAGFEVIYLGGDVPLDALMAAIDSHQPDVVGLSSTGASAESSIGRTVSQLQATTPDLPILVGGQGIPDSILREDRVISAPTLEGLVVLIQGLLADQPDSSVGKRNGPSAPPDPPFTVDAGGETPEDRLLSAATDSANLARTHARMAHSYRRLAYADAITEGPNRRAFDDRLALLNDSPEAAPVAVLMVDLDGFKHANDTFGHAAGDALLRDVYEAISSCLREADFAARLGGDEFAVLLPRAASAEAEEIAERVLVAVRKAGRKASVTATIGIAPLAGDPRHTMLEADLALYEGKAAGGNRIGVRRDPPPTRKGNRQEGAPQ